MERQANYALVGAISTLLLIAGVVFVVWLGGSRFSNEYDRYRIIFEGPVRGLSVGGDVQFNGIKMGQIERIRLDEDNPNRVITDISLQARTPVRRDSLASTETQGISGTSIVQISAGDPQQPLLREAERSHRPVIRSKPNAMSSLIQGGGQMVESATRALNQVNKLISDENIADLSATIKDVRLTMGELAENRAMFDHAGSLLAKLDSAATDIEASAALIREMGEGDGRRTLAEMSEAATELKAAIGEARGTLAHINRQSETIGTTTLPAVNAAMHSLQETSESLDGFLREIRQNPRRALTKDSGQELELPR